jgi:hypothetical protein
MVKDPRSHLARWESEPLAEAQRRIDLHVRNLAGS